MFPFPQKTQTRNLAILFSRRLDFSLSLCSLCRQTLLILPPRCFWKVSFLCESTFNRWSKSPRHLT